MRIERPHQLCFQSKFLCEEDPLSSFFSFIIVFHFLNYLHYLGMKILICNTASKCPTDRPNGGFVPSKCELKHGSTSGLRLRPFFSVFTTKTTSYTFLRKSSQHVMNGYQRDVFTGTERDNAIPIQSQ